MVSSGFLQSVIGHQSSIISHPLIRPGRPGEPCEGASTLHGGGVHWASRNTPCAAFLSSTHCVRRVFENDELRLESTRRTEPVTSPQAESPLGTCQQNPSDSKGRVRIRPRRSQAPSIGLSRHWQPQSNSIRDPTGRANPLGPLRREILRGPWARIQESGWHVPEGGGFQYPRSPL